MQRLTAILVYLESMIDRLYVTCEPRRMAYSCVMCTLSITKLIICKDAVVIFIDNEVELYQIEIFTKLN